MQTTLTGKFLLNSRNKLPNYKIPEQIQYSDMFFFSKYEWNTEKKTTIMTVIITAWTVELWVIYCTKRLLAK